MRLSEHKIKCSVYLYVEELSEYSPRLRIIQMLNPMAKSYTIVYVNVLTSNHKNYIFIKFNLCNRDILSVFFYLLLPI